MAEVNDATMEEVPEKNETNKNVTNKTLTESVPSKDNQEGTLDVSMEPSDDNAEHKSTGTEPGTGKYTEEQRLKRKEYFKQLREKRRLARERYQKRFGKNYPRNPRPTNVPKLKTIITSYNMTEEEKKMLDYYTVRFSSLKTENELLHKRMAYLMKENMRFLQMGPASSSV